VWIVLLSPSKSTLSPYGGPLPGLVQTWVYLECPVHQNLFLCSTGNFYRAVQPLFIRNTGCLSLKPLGRKHLPRELLSDLHMVSLCWRLVWPWSQLPGLQLRAWLLSRGNSLSGSNAFLLPGWDNALSLCPHSGFVLWIAMKCIGLPP
jgi:hypothetical protein